jgi:hypothetical protein
MMTQAREQQLSWILRVALAMCFIGHGAFGVLTKEQWVPFFGVVGLTRDTAFALMPIIGMSDIALGVLVLLAPIRAAVLYMAVWALWTAALRPLSGDSVFELLERAGNYGIPLALLLLLGPARSFRDWITRANAPTLTPEREALIWRVLSVTTALLLVGHGGLALEEKGILVRHAGVLGLGAGSVVLAGAMELVLALVVLLAPRPGLLVGVALWKIGTELLYPIAGAPVWEFIERGGSYAAPLVLAVLARRRVATRLRIAPRMAGLGAAAAAIILSAVAPAALNAQKVDNVPVAPAGILDSLRRGGYVILCRHAATDHDQSDRGATRALQRNLSPAGEEEAKSIGAAIRSLRIPIGEVRASPMYRNRETATYAFGNMVVDSTLVRESALRAMLVAPVPRGTNRAIVVRQGGIYDALRDFGVRDTSEGDCFVVQPEEAAKFRVLARLRVQDWRTGSSR